MFELEYEVAQRKSELVRQSDELVSELQRQDTLRKAADELQIRAHQVCVCVFIYKCVVCVYIEIFHGKKLRAKILNP